MTYSEFQKFCRENQILLFTINDLKILFKTYSESYLRLKLYRWKQKGYIINLKKGLYQLLDGIIDEFEVASRLIIPSYISLESALSHYSIIPDVSSNVSSVTTKNTRHFRIQTISKPKKAAIQYDYYHIKTGLFMDYHNLRDTIFIASPEKSIIDFFYFRKPSKDHQFFERLNPEILKNIDMRKVKKMAEKYPNYVQQLTAYLSHVITH